MAQNYGYEYKAQRYKIFKLWRESNFFDDPNVDMLGFLITKDNYPTCHHIILDNNQTVGLSLLGSKTHRYLDNVLKLYDKEAYEKVNNFLTIVSSVVYNETQLTEDDKKCLIGGAKSVSLLFNKNLKPNFYNDQTKRNQKSDVNVIRSDVFKERINALNINRFNTFGNLYYENYDNISEFISALLLNSYENFKQKYINVSNGFNNCDKYEIKKYVCDFMGNHVRNKDDISPSFGVDYFLTHSSVTILFKIKYTDPLLFKDWKDFFKSISNIDPTNKNNIISFHINLISLRRRTANFFSSQLINYKLGDKSLEFYANEVYPKFIELLSNSNITIQLTKDYVYKSIVVQRELDELTKEAFNESNYSLTHKYCEEFSSFDVKNKFYDNTLNCDWMGVRVTNDNISSSVNNVFLTNESLNLLTFLKENRKPLYEKWCSFFELYKVLDVDNFNEIMMFHKEFSTLRHETVDYISNYYYECKKEKNKNKSSDFIRLLEDDDIKIYIKDGFTYGNKKYNLLEKYVKPIDYANGFIYTENCYFTYDVYDISSDNIYYNFDIVKKIPSYRKEYRYDFMGNKIFDIPTSYKEDYVLSNHSLDILNHLINDDKPKGAYKKEGLSLYKKWIRLFNKYRHVTTANASYVYEELMELRNTTANYLNRVGNAFKYWKMRYIYTGLSKSLSRDVGEICFNDKVVYSKYDFLKSISCMERDNVCNKYYSKYDSSCFMNMNFNNKKDCEKPIINKSELIYKNKIKDDYMGNSLTTDFVFLENVFEPNDYLISKTSARILWYLHKKNKDLFEDWKSLFKKYKDINKYNFKLIFDEVINLRKSTREYFISHLSQITNTKMKAKMKSFIDALSEKDLNIEPINIFIRDDKGEKDIGSSIKNVQGLSSVDFEKASVIDFNMFSKVSLYDVNKDDNIVFNKKKFNCDKSEDERLNYLFYIFLFGKGSDLTKEIKQNNPELYLKWLSFFNILEQDYSVFNVNQDSKYIFISTVDRKLSALKKETLAFLRKQMRNVKNSHDKREIKKLINDFGSNVESIYLPQINETYTYNTLNKSLRTDYNYMLYKNESLNCFVKTTLSKPLTVSSDDNESLFGKNELRKSYKYMSIRNRNINMDYCLNNKPVCKKQEKNEKPEFKSQNIFNEEVDVLSKLKENRSGLYKEWIDLLSQISKNNNLRKAKDLENKHQQLLARTNTFINKVNSKSKIRRREVIYKR